MVTHLLDTENIDEDLESLAEEKAEGVPFFIEEFIKSLKELKIIERKNHTYHLSKDIQSVTIPSTIHDIIMARVDKLPVGAKEMLQIGSVIEREFSYELVKKVSGLPEQEIQSRLSALKDAELLFARSISSETTYIFKHSLIRDVVYDSVLTRKKKKLHEDIGNAIEKLYRDKLVEHYGVMTEHFICCGNYEKAAKYSMLEARRARKAASIVEAIIYTQKRIDCIEKLPQTDEMYRHLIDARTNLGLFYTEMNCYSEIKVSVEPVVDLAIKMGDKRRLSQINTIIGTYHIFASEDFPNAFNHLNDALKISDKINDFVSMVFACYYLGMAHCFSCQFQKASIYLKQATDIVAAAKNTWAVSTNKSTESLNFNWNGKIISGSEASKEALRLAEESGDIFPKVIAYTAYGFSCYCEGIFEKAKKHLLMATKIYENINVAVWNGFTHLILGEIYFEIEEYHKAMDHFREMSLILDQNKLCPSWSNLSKIGLAKVKIKSGETGTKLEPLINYFNKNKIKMVEGWMASYIAEILINIDDHPISEAESWIKKAIEKDKKNKMRFNLARDYTLYAKLFKRKGEQLKVRENLGKAIEIFKECGADGWVEKYEREVVALS
jgi:tetratricopeptide (TPR) repeat protein